MSCFHDSVHHAYELGAVSMGDDHLTKFEHKYMVITLCCHSFLHAVKDIILVAPMFECQEKQFNQ